MLLDSSERLRELERERLLRTLAAVTFLVFFQAYMVAPLIARLALDFRVPIQRLGLIVTAYLIPYGVSTLLYGLLADRVGRRRVLLASLTAFVVLTAATSTARSFSQLLVWRLLTGVGASGVVPLGLVLVGDLFPFRERGRPLGWVFGAMAGGAAFGSTFGVMLEPFVGWRMLFALVAALAAIPLYLLSRNATLLAAPQKGPRRTLREVTAGYRSLLLEPRGLRTYVYVFWNGIFHSGIFTWLGVYFARRHGLGEVGIGLAILGYGIPGFLLGPIIGRAADRWGRKWLVPAGLALSVLAAVALMVDLPLLGAAFAVTLLSLGYDMTQPVLAGIVTSLGGPQRGGQAMGLNVFALFVGFGVGAYFFSELLRNGFSAALGTFGAIQALAALAALLLFRTEGRALPQSTGSAG